MLTDGKLKEADCKMTNLLHELERVCRERGIEIILDDYIVLRKGIVFVPEHKTVFANKNLPLGDVKNAIWCIEELTTF